MKKTIWNIPFIGEKEKWNMQLGKFMSGAVIKGYYVILTSEKKILADGAYKTKEKEIAAHKLLNFTTYNEIIL